MNKNKSKAFKKFQREIEINLDRCYSEALSDSIKNGLKTRGKHYKKKSCNVKRCKV
jgi:hypothetical protein